MYEPFRLIDLFAGAGGLTLGFTGVRAGDGGAAFLPVWANDFNKDAAATYNANFGEHCTHGDIVDILEDPATVIPKADVVIGGPPCQGFSLLNKNRESDPRKQLWRPYMEIVARAGARVFVMENVRQLLTSAELHEIREEAERLGFDVTSARLCAADYGVPQERYRAFIVGVRSSSPAAAFPPKKTHYNERGLDVQSILFEEHANDPVPWRTVHDAIADLPEPIGTEIRDEPGPLDLHFGRNPTDVSMKRYRAVPPGGNRFDLQKNAPEITPKCWIRKKSGGTDLFGRLWWDRPSVTIRTEFFKPEKGRYLHPEQHRPITHREAARLQSFPDDFVFRGSKIEIARQIGNAVPPLLGQAVARSVYALLTGDEKRMWEVGVHEPRTEGRYVAQPPTTVHQRRVETKAFEKKLRSNVKQHDEISGTLAETFRNEGFHKRVDLRRAEVERVSGEWGVTAAEGLGVCDSREEAEFAISVIEYLRNKIGGFKLERFHPQPRHGVVVYRFQQGNGLALDLALQQPLRNHRFTGPYPMDMMLTLVDLDLPSPTSAVSGYPIPGLQIAVQFQGSFHGELPTEAQKEQNPTGAIEMLEKKLKELRKTRKNWRQVAATDQTSIVEVTCDEWQDDKTRLMILEDLRMWSVEAAAKGSDYREATRRDEQRQGSMLKKTNACTSPEVSVYPATT